MIVAVSAEKNDPDSPVSPYFGRSRWFVLYDTVRESRDVVENPYADSLGDAGIQSARMLIEKNVDALITDGVGRNAFKVLSAAGILLYTSTCRSGREAIGLLLEGRLSQVSAPEEVVDKRRRRRFGRRKSK